MFTPMHCHASFLVIGYLIHVCVVVEEKAGDIGRFTDEGSVFTGE